MGRIATTREELTEWLLDVVLFKTGLALSDEELRAHVDDQRLVGPSAEPVTLRAEEVEALVHRVLYELGHVASLEPTEPSIEILLKYKDDDARKAIADAVGDLFFAHLARAAMTQWGQPIDVTSVVAEAKRLFGADGLAIADEYVRLAVAHAQSSPWSKTRRVDWREDAALRDLFDSANLLAPHGTFFDQRYIDYLARQFDGAIDRIHWRKFEALTCEYFARTGCRVEIGPGTNDDNIDARVWWPDEALGAPAAILIQCKRERETIGKLVVKALYADVVWERASAGLIVTTQRLSRGAEAVRVAREYPIQQADRDTLRIWLEAMRSTGQTST